MKCALVGPIFFALSVCSFSFAGQNAIDPCPNKEISSAELEACCSAAQKHVNIEADELANKIAAELIQESTDDKETILANFARKTARSLKKSQTAWRHYRDRYCNAVMYNHDTGTSAWGDHEGCMFQMGEERIRELQLDFTPGGS